LSGSPGPLPLPGPATPEAGVCSRRTRVAPVPRRRSLVEVGADFPFPRAAAPQSDGREQAQLLAERAEPASAEGRSLSLVWRSSALLSTGSASSDSPQSRQCARESAAFCFSGKRQSSLTDGPRPEGQRPALSIGASSGCTDRTHRGRRCSQARPYLAGRPQTWRGERSRPLAVAPQLVRSTSEPAAAPSLRDSWRSGSRPSIVAIVGVV
jgi:hypothetical protein